METLVYLAYLMQNDNHALEVVTRLNHKIPNKYVRRQKIINQRHLSESLLWNFKFTRNSREKLQHANCEAS